VSICNSAWLCAGMLLFFNQSVEVNLHRALYKVWMEAFSNKNDVKKGTRRLVK